jgi:hypothetical protein
MKNTEQLEAKLKAAVEDCARRFLAFIEPHTTHIEVILSKYPERPCDLAKIDPKDERVLFEVIYVCLQAAREIDEQNQKNGVIKDTSDYTMTMFNFVEECMDLHVCHFKTVIATCKSMIKYAKKMNEMVTKDRNVLHKNPKFQKIKQEIDATIARDTEILMINQMKLAEIDMLYRDLRNTVIHR